VALAMMATAGPAIAAGTGTVHEDHPPASLTAHTILSGSSHGWSSPDDLTSIGADLFVSFQNGVPSTGGSAGTPSQSTIVKFKVDGTIEHTWQLTGKCDGLTADPEHHRVLATHWVIKQIKRGPCGFRSQDNDRRIMLHSAATGPRELPAVEVNPAQVPRAGNLWNSAACALAFPTRATSSSRLS
jgi:hypothetical protein